MGTIYYLGYLIDTPSTNQGPTWWVIMNQPGFVGRYGLVQGLEITGARQIPPDAHRNKTSPFVTALFSSSCFSMSGVACFAWALGTDMWRRRPLLYIFSPREKPATFRAIPGPSFWPSPGRGSTKGCNLHLLGKVWDLCSGATGRWFTKKKFQKPGVSGEILWTQFLRGLFKSDQYCGGDQTWCKCMVILRDFLSNSVLFGLVI